MPEHRVTRFARVRGSGISAEAVIAYLPANYQVVASGDGWVDISGKDDSGWTLDGYVIPRLRSGLYAVEETTAQRQFWDDVAVTEMIERKHGIMSLADEYASEWERF